MHRGGRRKLRRPPRHTVRSARRSVQHQGVDLFHDIQHCVRDGIQHGDADKTIESFTKAVERFSNMS